MSSIPGAVADGPNRMKRGINATWWYTVSGIVFFQLVLVLVWWPVAIDRGPVAGSIVGIGGLVWTAATVPVLLRYRHRADTGSAIDGWRANLAPFVIVVIFAVAASATTGYVTFGALPVLQMLMLLNWPRGIRARVALVATAVLVATWIIDRRIAPVLDPENPRSWILVGFFSIILPIMTVLSLWWWDVIGTLDRARAAESRLGATQERLRVATDVHDLQGHHLQVIALQLELAERLLEKERPDTALEQLRLARTSVDKARQGTRDLALRFRGVPLRDEIANAVDLLRAAGTTAEATVSDDADRAPASVLGPVIRETTTNVLKHGNGRWARLSLRRESGFWRYEIANDSSDAAAGGDGSGLEGIARRVGEVGGALEVDRSRHEFTVVVTVPEEKR
ncbi:histidine kinase [uncultured Microbacterium sp.]|uniref:sensor histidine kinase n=1 Tax=uncultured Microbacterium sp. TaxID=191216 RepID=UPI00262C8EDE|nr:histidine kinase [uncultured Microbacterium sp.]